MERFVCIWKGYFSPSGKKKKKTPAGGGLANEFAYIRDCNNMECFKPYKHKGEKVYCSN